MEGTCRRDRRRRCNSRPADISAISRRSLAVRARIRRRSVSILVSPGPREQVFQLRQLDLGLAGLAPRVLGEDVEDERGAVDDLDLYHAFQAAELARGQLAVADDRVGTGL